MTGQTMASTPPAPVGTERLGAKPGRAAGDRFLAVDRLTKRFGGLVAVNDVSLTVKARDILGIMGPNGSGKTTFLNCITGLYRPEQGTITFNGRSLVGLRPHQISRSGVGRTFQVPKVFLEMSLVDNMLAGVLHYREPLPALRQRAVELLAWIGLGDYIHHLGRELSGGQQKLLEFARALMPDPDLLLLDEPFAGVHPQLKERMMERLRELHGSGKTIVIVSHDVPSTYELCPRIVVFHNGVVIAEGTPAQIQDDERVVEAYFGN